MELTSGWSFIIIVMTLTIWITFGAIRRSKKSGCMTVGYIGLVVFSITSLGLSALNMLYSTTKSTIKGFMYGEHHVARVIDYESYESHDSDHGTTIMYTPIVEFKDDKGNLITKKLNFSSSSIELGDKYNVMYLSEDGEVVALGFVLAITFIALLIFSVIPVVLTIGMLLYANNSPMTAYWDIVKKIGFLFFIPFLMIGFELMLIYGLFFGNSVPFFVSVILVVFIIVLGLGIWGYLKNITTKGVPKMTRVSSNRWVGGWDN